MFRLGRSHREQWSEEAVGEEPLVNSEALEMSKNRGKEKNEGRDDAEDTSQQVPLLTSKTGGGVDMVSLMQF